jgi:hypothetical protein
MPESFLGVAPSAPMLNGIDLSRVVLADAMFIAEDGKSLKCE